MNKDDLLKKMRDPRFYLESFCKIKTKPRADGVRGLVPFKLKPAQLDIFNTIKIKDAFSEYWERYLKMGKRDYEKEEAGD